MAAAESEEIIEKKLHRTNLQRLLHTLCLLLPIGCAFSGYFAAAPVWSFFKNTAVPEIFRFICSLFFFAIPSVIIFIVTRNLNTIIKINIFSKKTRPDN